MDHFEECYENTFWTVSGTLMNDYNPVFIVSILSILYIKKPNDVLQGINKLDNLLKVSVFQYYKDKSLYRAHSLVSADADEEIQEFKKFDSTWSLKLY